MEPQVRPELFKYTDYRAFLRDWFEQTKLHSSFMSYRYLARRTGIDAGYLAHVFQGNKHLSEQGVQKLIDLLAFAPNEERYFEAMVAFNKARRESDIHEKFEKMMQWREAGARILNQQEYRYWMHWYIPAIRLTLLTEDFKGDFQALARRLTPSITAKQAHEAVDVLMDLGLVELRPDGVYEVQDAHLSTGNAWASAAIREFQSKTLGLAQESLRNHPPELREIATLTLAIPKEEIATLQEMMRDFRSKVAKWAVGMDRSDYVLQMNLACFPLSVSTQDAENHDCSDSGGSK